MRKDYELMTQEYNAALMDKFYLVRAGVNQYVWFRNYESARDYLLSPWVDARFSREVVTPAK